MLFRYEMTTYRLPKDDNLHLFWSAGYYGASSASLIYGGYMNIPTFTKVWYDRGNCRTYYNVVGDRRRSKKLYCRFEGEDTMYTCSKDGEPDSPIGNTKYTIQVKED